MKSSRAHNIVGHMDADGTWSVTFDCPEPGCGSIVYATSSFRIGPYAGTCLLGGHRMTFMFDK